MKYVIITLCSLAIIAACLGTINAQEKGITAKIFISVKSINKNVDLTNGFVNMPDNRNKSDFKKYLEKCNSGSGSSIGSFYLDVSNDAKSRPSVYGKRGSVTVLESRMKGSNIILKMRFENISNGTVKNTITEECVFESGKCYLIMWKLPSKEYLNIGIFPGKE